MNMRNGHVIALASLVFVVGCPTRRVPTRPMWSAAPPRHASSMTVVRLWPHQGRMVDLLGTAAADARDRHQRPFVEFGAAWCASSRAVEAALMDQRMIDAFNGTYIVQLEANAWLKEGKQAGFQAFPIPAFFELDAAGRPTGRLLRGDAWGADTVENMPPVLRAFFQGQ